MIGLSPATSYPANEPVELNTVAFLGDLHMGRGTNATVHADLAHFDLLHLDLPLLVQVGDMTENGTAPQDVLALSVLAEVPADAVRVLVGNHDLESGRSGDVAAAAWGFNSRNWTFDLGPVLLVSPSYNVHPQPQDGGDPQITLAQTDLDWLAAQLDAATKECWVVCHAPIAGGLAAASDTGGFAVAPDTDVRALLDSRPQATCWFSGHTHTAVDHAAFANLKNIGTRSIANVNVSAIAYVNPGDDLGDPVCSIFATYREGGCDLRIRDHTRRSYRQWTEGGYVRTLFST